MNPILCPMAVWAATAVGKRSNLLDMVRTSSRCLSRLKCRRMQRIYMLNLEHLRRMLSTSKWDPASNLPSQLNDQSPWPPSKRDQLHGPQRGCLSWCQNGVKHTTEKPNQTDNGWGNTGQERVCFWERLPLRKGFALAFSLPNPAPSLKTRQSPMHP